MMISVCMILKDEGNTIYRALDSVKCVASEYILGIDTQTQDNTREEIKRFFKDHKCKHVVYDLKWAEHFGNARNTGLKRATGKWALILDGHEFFPDIWYNVITKNNVYSQEALKEVVKRLPNEDTDEAFFCLYQQPFIGQIPNNYFMQPRIYRLGKSKLKGYTDKKLQFGRAAHNTILYSRPEKGIHYPEVIIIHDASESNRKARQKQRLDMNIRQLKADIKIKKNDTRALFYLGNTYLEAKKYQDSIKTYEKYLKAIDVEHSEVYQAYLHKAMAHKENGEKDLKKECLYKAMMINPVRRDAYIMIGDHYLEEKDWERAIFNYNTAMTIKPSPSRMFNNGGSYTFLPHQQIARAYKGAGDTKLAIAHLQACLNYTHNEGWVKEINEMSGKKKKVLIVDSIGSFTNDLKAYLEKKGYDVVRMTEWNNVLASWADFIWCEWADHNAAQIGNFANKTVLRLHGYEAYNNRRLFPNIPWGCKRVVFVAKHIQELVQGMIPGLNGQCSFIPNGVDTEKFFIKNTERDLSNIGIAGYMNIKKNPMRLARIIRENPKFKFHLRINWQDLMLKESFEHEVQDCTNIVYHGRYDNLNDFWNMMHSVISTSDIESFSYNIAEAMAAGCRPYIYNWKGAESIWHKDYIFKDKLQLSMKPKDRNQYRQYIVDNFPLNRSLADMEQVLVK